MKLHLLRHAKTDQFSVTGKDYDRELLTRGKKQSLGVLNFLENQDLKSTLVYCSGATRTRETLSFLIEQFTETNVHFSNEFYLCSLQSYLEWLWQQNHEEDLFIIGHNFGISDLANYFLEENHEMQTAEYICIEFPFNNWTETSIATGNLFLRFRPSV